MVLIVWRWLSIGLSENRMSETNKARISWIISRVVVILYEDINRDRFRMMRDECVFCSRYITEPFCMRNSKESITKPFTKYKFSWVFDGTFFNLEFQKSLIRNFVCCWTQHRFRRILRKPNSIVQLHGTSKVLFGTFFFQCIHLTTSQKHSIVSILQTTY